jgi:hypothetical protein
MLALAGLLTLASVARPNYALDHPVLGGNKKADKTSARVGDLVTIAIDVNGSGTPVQTVKVITHPVDIVIMMDCSDSYSYEIGTMQAKLSTLLSSLSAAGLNLTVGFIAFGNSWSIGECPINTNGSVNVAAVRQLTTDAASIVSYVNGLRAWGSWEPWGDAIWLGNRWISWRPEAYKIAILVTDEPCDQGRRVPGPLSTTFGYDYDGSVLWDEVSSAIKKQIRYIAIDSGAGLTTTQLKKVAGLTEGLYYNFSHAKATDFVKVINNTVTEVVQGELKETAGHNVVVTDVVSSQVELVAGSFSLAPTSQTVNPDGSVTLKWNLGDVKYNEATRITYKVRMITCGQIQTNVDADIDYLDWEGTAKSIQLPIPSVVVPHPTIESCDVAGIQKDTFILGETVYVNGSNYASSATYPVYVVEDVSAWQDGMVIPTRVEGTATTLSSNGAGSIVATAVWNPSLTLGRFDIVVDVNRNGKYDSGVDALDDSDVQVTAGFWVIPEYGFGTVMGLAGCLAALGVFCTRRQKTP